jgi:hypothetical protein
MRIAEYAVHERVGGLRWDEGGVEERVRGVDEIPVAQSDSATGVVEWVVARLEGFEPLNGCQFVNL